MTQLAWGFMLTSPVTIPTESNSLESSLYFWFERAFIGEVYITFLLCFIANAIPYSATTVFPALVWAATKTLSFFSSLSHALAPLLTCKHKERKKENYDLELFEYIVQKKK